MRRTALLLASIALASAPWAAVAEPPAAGELLDRAIASPIPGATS